MHCKRSLLALHQAVSAGLSSYCRILQTLIWNAELLYNADFAVKCRPDGRALFRNSVLERQGWYVIVVPWFEWHALLTKNAKVGYLKQKMKAVVSQYRHDTWAASSYTSKVDG